MDSAIELELIDFLSYNVAGKKIRKNKKILLYGTCIYYEYPDILRSLTKDRVPLAVCLEKEHMNMVALKLASILARIPLKEIVVLTVDGSPHCVQLHMAVEEVIKIVKPTNIIVKHLVIENNKIIEIDEKCIKYARYLSKIKRMLEKINSI